jgi:uncharacterized protein YlxW (UPF0749 family)
MIAALIENYEVLTVVGVFSIMMAWYLWHQTKAQVKREDKHDKIQAEERLFHRKLITNDLKSLHDDNTKNIELNNKSLSLLKDVSENQNKLCKLIEGVDRRINDKKG